MLFIVKLDEICTTIMDRFGFAVCTEFSALFLFFYSFFSPLYLNYFMMVSKLRCGKYLHKDFFVCLFHFISVCKGMPHKTNKWTRKYIKKKVPMVFFFSSVLSTFYWFYTIAYSSWCRNFPQTKRLDNEYKPQTMCLYTFSHTII